MSAAAPIPTVSVASQQLAAGAVTAEGLVTACLERIAVRDASVRAWQHLDPEAALAEARRRDRERRRSAIHGVPIGIKDIFDTADMPTTYGSGPFAGHRPRLDAVAVAMLRRAGAVILGKTKTTEFANLHPSDTTNPFNAAHTPGGSSSGSAAAVAAGMVPAATGTQTMGSVIRPAAFCGTVGFKPSFGSISRAGLALLSETNDTVGLFCRAVDDLPLLMGAICGVEPDAFLTPDAGAPRVGVVRGPEADLAQPETLDALAETERAFAGAGAAVREIECPGILMRAMEAHWTIALFEIARSLAAVRAAHGDGLSERLSDLLDEGAAIPLARYHDSLAVADQARAAVADLLGDHDVILTPAAPGEAPRGLETTGDPVFNRLWTMIGGPCVTLPVIEGPNGLPVGIQLVGRIREDARLLSCAAWAEQVLAARSA